MNAKFLGLAVVGALAATPASALTFVQDVNVNNRFGGYFNPFDSSLGTLTRVTVEATVSDQRSAAAQFWDPGYVGLAQMDVTGAVGTSLTGLIDYSGSSGLVALSSSNPYLLAAGTGSGLFEYSGDALSRFLGNGRQYIGVDKAELASVSYVLPSDFDGYLYELTNPASISIAHRITYEYDAPSFAANVQAPVPEPASWAMMIIGFGVVGHALRRSQRSRRLVQAA